MSGRYRAGGIQAEFQPGSRGRVLHNVPGIHSVREMAFRESEALLVATRRMIEETDADHRFVAADICRMHRLWLGEIYPWAGMYRMVNLGKSDFMFAAATEIPRLMREFERKIACDPDGAAGGAATARFRWGTRPGTAALHYCGACGFGTGLCADDGGVQPDHCADVDAQRTCLIWRFDGCNGRFPELRGLRTAARVASSTNGA